MSVDGTQMGAFGVFMTSTLLQLRKASNGERWPTRKRRKVAHMELPVGLAKK